MIRRRLSPNERDLLQSGEVFVWEEADYKGGLERWTDGRKWGASRMREPFLFYEEKALPTQEEREAKAARRFTSARKMSDAQTPYPPAFKRQERPSKVDGLTKQTYSAWVWLPGTTQPKKWHLTAYFSASTYSQLPVIEHDPTLSRIQVPNGIYVTGKGLTRRNHANSPGHTLPSNTHSPNGTHAQRRLGMDDDEDDGLSITSSEGGTSSPRVPPIITSFSNHSSSPRSSHLQHPYPHPSQQASATSGTSGGSTMTPHHRRHPSHTSISTPEDCSRSPWSTSSLSSSLPLTPPNQSFVAPPPTHSPHISHSHSYSYSGPHSHSPTLPSIRHTPHLNAHLNGCSPVSPSPSHSTPTSIPIPHSAHSAHSPANSTSISLPPTTSLAFSPSASSYGYDSYSQKGAYVTANGRFAPRSEEDRRAVDAFRVVL
jgi:hypothetical protein